MSLNLLICSLCRYPLKLTKGVLAGVTCPRCNTWVVIDAQCSTSCTSCFKAKEGSSFVCGDKEQEISV